METINKTIAIRDFHGDIQNDIPTRLMYATDASAYKEMPKAVVYPRNADDIKKIIIFAIDHNLSIIPRTAGTSLAGQVVGNGIIVDFSRYLNKVLEINVQEKWVKVQPGVVLDELNILLKKDGLFFGPETSTSNRCMIGGMVGNNACGAHSLIYGSTRDHLLEVKGFLSDGSEVVFGQVSKDEFEIKCKIENLEGRIYSHINGILSNPLNAESIRQEYPEPKLERRNSGYAIDKLLDTEIFSDTNNKFNFSKLIAGSEGTLIIATEIKLNLLPLPPKEKGVICAHFNTLEEAIQGNLLALTFKPGAIELIDDIILNCTKDSIEQRKNRFFVNGNPGAILVIEFARETKQEIESLANQVKEAMQVNGLGYDYPLITGPDINKVWALRKAALGLLTNIPGDAKPVSLVEDTAVPVNELANYIADFKEILKKYNLSCVYHAHIASGELHLRPVLNLKDSEHIKIFRDIATKVAHLVKKYRGSLSGEHGDGRLRGEFIPIIIGQRNYELVKDLKYTWDPRNILNPGKIVDTPKMDSSLRYTPGIATKEVKTYFDFSDSKGYIRHIERCNGAGDCRKTEIIGGTMCPSFMASRKESTTTRARANILREYISNSDKKNPFDHKEIYDVLDLCLSCKACKAECPSNVDMTKLKAEFLQHYYDANGTPLRSRLIANMPFFYNIFSHVPWAFNFVVTNKLLSGLFKSTVGFAKEREIPTLSKITVKKWAKKNLAKLNSEITTDNEIYLFVDEFINFLESHIGIKSIKLLHILGYKIQLINIKDSGRTCLSKGMVSKAKKKANQNVKSLQNLISETKPLVGLEPSSILTFRDEYPELVAENLKDEAKRIAKHTKLIEEFIADEMAKNNVNKSMFTNVNTNIILHGHCYIKALSTTKPIKYILSYPENFKVAELPTGCCGMAGAFGFEKEHYELSQKIGEMVLFPAIRKQSQETIIAASGTSCRHQIKEATGRTAYHPVEILFDSLKNK